MTFHFVCLSRFCYISPIGGLLGCFFLSVIVSHTDIKVFMKWFAHIFTLISLGCILRTRIVLEQLVILLFNLWSNHHTIPHDGATILYSYRIVLLFSNMFQHVYDIHPADCRVVRSALSLLCSFLFNKCVTMRLAILLWDLGNFQFWTILSSTPLQNICHSVPWLFVALTYFLFHGKQVGYFAGIVCVAELIACKLLCYITHFFLSQTTRLWSQVGLWAGHVWVI